jgi:hypothetical protein
MATTQERGAPARRKRTSVTALKTESEGKAVKAQGTTAAIPKPQRASRRRKPALDEQAVRERAYLIWIEEGRPEGRHVEHWARARGELEREAA